jgi:hypothetical protein
MRDAVAEGGLGGGHDGDANAVELEVQLSWESIADRALVGVAVDRDQLSVSAELLEHRLAGQVPGMDDQVSVP